MLVHVRQQFYTKRYAHEEKENKLKINQRMRGCVIASFPLPFYITSCGKCKATPLWIRDGLRTCVNIRGCWAAGQVLPQITLVVYRVGGVGLGGPWTQHRVGVKNSAFI